MLIQDLTLRVSIVFDISLGIACEHAELVFGAGLSQIVDPEGTLTVNNILLDHGFAAAGFSNHHVKVADVFARRHIPRGFPAIILIIAKENHIIYSF